jgi:hypothetical protein
MASPSVIRHSYYRLTLQVLTAKLNNVRRAALAQDVPGRLAYRKANCSKSLKTRGPGAAAST